jgi:NAD(P)-dependent dehydrogenase (short-subunit alcohol dehydrogenase family)
MQRQYDSQTYHEESVSMRLNNKIAIITGAASGIGKATATLFAKEGAGIVIADWNDHSGEETTGLIQEQGGEAIFVHTDVSKTADIQKMVQTAIRNFGRLDILVNNAAYVGVSPKLVDLQEEMWDMIVDITLKGTFLGCKYAIPEMIKAGGGAIVNISSVGGVVGFESAPAYCAAKGAVIQLTKAIAIDYAAQGIRANSMCPGTIDTEGTRWAHEFPDVMQRVETRTLLKRQGTSLEMAYVILFLASDDASYITGANFIADGGWTVI